MTLCVGDLMAYEITMSDEDRMALMQMVKEGKISTETAVSVVCIVPPFSLSLSVCRVWCVCVCLEWCVCRMVCGCV